MRKGTWSSFGAIFLRHPPAGDGSNPAIVRSPAINAPLDNLNSNLPSLLQAFREQTALIRSIVVFGCDLELESTGAGNVNCPTVITRVDGEPAATLESLARHAREVNAPTTGDDLLLLPARMLTAMMTPLADDFSFRAVVALLPQTPDQPGDENGWRLRRSLFDRGLICIGSADVAGSKALCFLASDAVLSFTHLNVESRGMVTMAVLVEGARFANRLFRYACVKLYALRHGLTAAFPEWEGEQLFGLSDTSCAGLTFPKQTFRGFADDDRRLWEDDNPPINVDLEGYFQELPECWRKHRALLRRMFQLPAAQLEALDAWKDRVTDGGRRTLVAIHVRRGDYRILQLETAPWFRFVPEDWYLEWLRSIWPTLRNPILAIATDEPETIVPLFHEFETAPATSGLAEALPDHVRDFETLRRADYLAICNSSFSRMAGILAAPSQKCFLASFLTEKFEPYHPWIDPAFWARFANSWRSTPFRPTTQGVPVPMVNSKADNDAPPDLATIFFDVTDLLLYLLGHSTLSGIQRVQCEILVNLLEIPHPQPVRFVVLNKRGGLSEIEISGLLDILGNLRSDTTSRAAIESELHSLLNRMVPCRPRARDIFLTIGAFWTVKGAGLLLQRLKNSQVIIGVFIHDIISITSPEFFEARATRVFVKGVTEALTFADFILTTSQYNRLALAEHAASRKLAPLPIHLVPLGHELSFAAPADTEISSAVAAVVDKDYVLCVGTIEVRKNPAYLFNIWKMMVKAGRQNIPYLVFAGRQGWLVQDFIDQLKACNYLGGRIIVVHNATDVELALLYRKCMLTMFPSFVEGWGLPVGESLAHGKICICSAVGGVPEVAGDLVDFADPYNTCDGLEQLERYLDHPKLRVEREREIVGRFEPRSWRKSADDFLKSTQSLARQVESFKGVAAITLPPDRYLAISSDAAAVLMDPMEGALSAELSCISGWHAPEIAGVRAAQPDTMIRFRAMAPAGTRVNLVMRLAAHGRDFRIGIHSGSGAESEASVADGAEKMAVLVCDVEADGLVTAHLSVMGGTFDEDGFSDASYYSLKGILYFDPKRLVLNKLKARGVSGSLARSTVSVSVEPPGQPAETVSGRDTVLLRPASMDDSRRAASFGTFLQMTDSFWPSSYTSDRDAPIFADHADRRAFYSGCGNSAQAPQVGRINDGIKLVRRGDQFVSMSRFSEGSVFDRSGVWRTFGYLQGSPPQVAPWLSIDGDGIRIAEDSLTSAPYYDHSYLFFYNGNLHNYYHWLIEGLLPLDILSRALGLNSKLRILLPKSMDINALIDHRETLKALGFDELDVVEVASNLIKVREAVWVDSEIVQTMPAPYLKDFQQRISALYAGLRTPRNRRLLVARKGPTRKIHNLEQVQSFLSRYDFETVYLEGMSMADQILLFQSAEFIIGPHGAGLSNLIFCEPGTKVIELMPSGEIRPFFWMISEKLDLVHGLQFCDTATSQDFQSSITVDIAKLQALIRMVEAHF